MRWDVGWAVWLAVPVVVTVLAAVWAWVRTRPAPTPGTDRSMRQHADYLDALAQTARGKERTELRE